MIVIFFLPNYTSSYSWRCLAFLRNLQARKTTTRTARVHKPRARRITSVFVNFLSSSSSETYKETNKQTNIGYWPLLIKICYKSCPIFFQLRTFCSSFVDWSTAKLILPDICCVCLSFYSATTGLYHMTICPLNRTWIWKFLRKVQRSANKIRIEKW